MAHLCTGGPFPMDVGPLQHDEVDVGDSTPVRCLKNGLWLSPDKEGAVGDSAWTFHALWTGRRRARRNRCAFGCPHTMQPSCKNLSPTGKLLSTKPCC
jgi:hypothetical protein